MCGGYLELPSYVEELETAKAKNDISFDSIDKLNRQILERLASMNAKKNFKQYKQEENE